MLSYLLQDCTWLICWLTNIYSLQFSGEGGRGQLGTMVVQTLTFGDQLHKTVWNLIILGGIYVSCKIDFRLNNLRGNIFSIFESHKFELN